MNILGHTSNENTQKAPQERLTPVEAPLIRHHNNVVDRSVLTMYRYVIRVPLGDTVEHATTAPIEAPAMNRDFVFPAGAKQFENKMAETTHFAGPTAVIDYDNHENAEAIKDALASVDAVWQKAENV